MQQKKKKTCLDGHRGECKDCDRERKRIHYQNNKEKYREAYLEFMERNPEYCKKRYNKKY